MASGPTFVDFISDVYVYDPTNTAAKAAADALLAGFMQCVDANAMLIYLQGKGYTAVNINECNKLIVARQNASATAAVTSKPLCY